MVPQTGTELYLSEGEVQMLEDLMYVTGVFLGCSGYQQNRKLVTEPQGKLFSCHLYT